MINLLLMQFFFLLRLLESCVFSENAVKGEQTVVPSDNSYCDSPPPVVVMRRTLPNVNGKNVTTSNDNNNNMKRLKTGEEFVRVS